MRVAIVTGSRSWTDAVAVRGVLASFRPSLLIHGDCPTGADQIADAWACDQGDVSIIDMPALWVKEGKSAGPIRNSDMVKLGSLLSHRGHEVCVFAFPLPGGRGTQDCIRKAKRSGLTVCEVRT